mgnify:CR=1
MVNTFTDSLFTNLGKHHFTSPDGTMSLKLDSFKMCSVAGLVDIGRTSQTGVEFSEVITSISSYESEESIGTLITCTIPRGSSMVSFSIAEVGLYGDGKLCWVGKLDTPIEYYQVMEASIKIFLPIDSTDVNIDVETSPLNIALHNEDLNSHPYLLSIIKPYKPLDINSYHLASSLEDLTLTGGNFILACPAIHNKGDKFLVNTGLFVEGEGNKVVLNGNGSDLRIRNDINTVFDIDVNGVDLKIESNGTYWSIT